MLKSVSHQKMAWKNTSRGRLFLGSYSKSIDAKLQSFQNTGSVIHATPHMHFLFASKSEAHTFKGTDLGLMPLRNRKLST